MVLYDSRLALPAPAGGRPATDAVHRHGRWICYSITHRDSYADSSGTVWTTSLDHKHDIKIAENAFDAQWQPA